MGVPKELPDTIGKTEFKTSLRTKNLIDAKRLFPAHLEEAQKQIELAKLKLLGSSDIELNAIDCAIIAERWYGHVKADLDATGAYRTSSSSPVTLTVVFTNLVSLIPFQ